MMPDELQQELFELLAAWCEETLDEATRDRLEEVLASNAAAQQFYVEYLDVHARLYLDRCSPDVTASLLQGVEPQADRPAEICFSQANVLAARISGEMEEPLHSLVHRAAIPMPALPRIVRALQGRLVHVGIAATLLLALAIAWGFHWYRMVGNGNAEKGNLQVREGSSNRADVAIPPAEPNKPVVAKLSRLVDVRWADSHDSLAAGDTIRSGQILRLASGVAEIRFNIGVRVVLQAPAALQIESAKGARLERGKLSAEITSVAARGFQIRTPNGDFVDQGTEFGVEVSPDGNSRLHVFKGEVDVNRDFSSGPSEPQRLLASSEAWLERDSKSMTLLEDTGDSFIRTVEQAGRDRHVVAYWRFEDRPIGVVIPSTKANRRSARATLDSSFNGNDLFAYGDRTHPDISEDVPAAVIPGSKEPNRGCLDNSEPPMGNSRDLYTHSAFSHASPLDIQAITPEQWTIEASIKPARLESGVQTFIGRDGNEPGAAVVIPSRLVFQINGKDRIKIGFYDVQERWHQAIAEEVALAVEHWYHLAATSDGKTLRLYIDELDGHGYRLAAVTELPRSGSTALAKGTDGAEWSLGRGKVKNHVAENFRGWIDEVRISDVARSPAEFVFAEAGKGPAR
jgi:hypothetical protein